MVSMQNLAFFLVILGTTALFVASLQHWHLVHKLRGMGLTRQLSLSFYVALVLTAVGGFALTALALAI